MITPYDYLSVYHNWRATSNRGPKIYGCCPIHPDRTPSFMIDTKDQHWHCFGCDRHGDSLRLVKELEFSALGEKEWAPVYRRIEEIDGIPFPRRHLFLERRAEKPPATPEQKAIMTAALSWWHFLLYDTVAGKPGRTWLKEQGIEGILEEVGYAPRMNTALFESFDESISQALGTSDWYNLGVQTGILREDGTIRLQERIIFACKNDEDKVLFYQGRTVREDSPGKRRAKYLGTPHLAKEPFFVSLPNPRIQGFCLVESPKGPAAFASDRIPMGATLGSGVNAPMLQTLVKQFGTPVYIMTDNDPPEIDPESGEVMPGPGEKLAQKAATLCIQAGYEWYRILPPREYKDPDTWRKHEGALPLMREIEHVRIR